MHCYGLTILRNYPCAAGYPILGHSGASYGYRAFVILVPSLKAGVFVCMNGDDRSYSFRGPLLNLILDHLLGVSPWVDTNTLCTFPLPWHNVSASPPPPYDARRPLAHNVSAYLGVYENAAYGRLEIRLSDPRTRKGRTGSVFGRSQPSPRLMLALGFAHWDLVPLVPKYAALNSRVSSRADFPEYFYGIGKGVTAFLDNSPFIVHPPSTGSDVIEEISAPAFEKRIPPVFRRVTPGKSGSNSNIDTKSSVYMLLIFISFAVLISR